MRRVQQPRCRVIPFAEGELGGEVGVTSGTLTNSGGRPRNSRPSRMAVSKACVSREDARSRPAAGPPRPCDRGQARAFAPPTRPVLTEIQLTTFQPSNRRARCSESGVDIYTYVLIAEIKQRLCDGADPAPEVDNDSSLEPKPLDQFHDVAIRALPREREVVARRRRPLLEAMCGILAADELRHALQDRVRDPELWPAGSCARAERQAQHADRPTGRSRSRQSSRPRCPDGSSASKQETPSAEW